MNIIRANQIERMKKTLEIIIDNRNMLLTKVNKMDLKIGEMYADITKIGQNNPNPKYLYIDTYIDTPIFDKNLISLNYLEIENKKSCLK